MMNLVIMRHGDAALHGVDGSDHSRPLTEAGRGEAASTARELLALGIRPDVIFSSDALRTRQTCMEVLGVLQAQIDPSWDHSLYYGEVEHMRELVMVQPAEAGTILLVGHNPAATDALYWFSGERRFMKTATAAVLGSRDGTWREAMARPGRFRLAHILYPG